jgi:hypothetical protein
MAEPDEPPSVMPLFQEMEFQFEVGEPQLKDATFFTPKLIAWGVPLGWWTPR